MVGGMATRRRASPGRVSAIVFDLDGVLVDSTEVVERAWRRWAGEHGVPADDLLAIAHGRPAREVVQAFAPHLDAEHEARRLDDWETEGSDGLVAIPGAQECVDAARRGRWAIVTSGGRELATGRLRAVGLPIPEVLVTADDVTLGKPHPAPYERARQELAVPAAECLVVEDAPAGITAARRAGMTVLAVMTTHAAAALQDADLLFSTMHDVNRHLRETEH
jgi:mannitol-1-/sugar-/sorbitol-6-phosphatase